MCRPPSQYHPTLCFSEWLSFGHLATSSFLFPKFTYAELDKISLITALLSLAMIQALFFCNSIAFPSANLKL